MAQIQEIRLIDDLDGQEADETVEFGIDGKSYEIDLSTANAGKLREALAEFVGSARRAGGRAKRAVASAPVRRASVDREQNQAIREWAQRKGLEVSPRGRISRSVIEQYEAEAGR